MWRSHRKGADLRPPDWTTRPPRTQVRHPHRHRRATWAQGRDQDPPGARNHHGLRSQQARHSRRSPDRAA
eukprot:5526731-Prymnesium_polylepis.1